jgi:PAS domain S-box-containing protein
VRFSDEVRGSADPQLVAATACRMLAEQLHVDRTHWAEVDWSTQEFVVHGAFNLPTASPISGRFRIDAWEPFTARHVAGKTTVADDVQSDPEVSDAVKQQLAGLGIAARLAVPVMIDGTLRATLNANHRTPRQWSREDIALIEALAARAWAEIERARAGAALLASEEQMQLAIGATGMVTWQWLPATDRVTTSDSFANVYGLPRLSGSADGFALVLPEDKERHLAHVRRIAVEGGTYNSEFRIRRPDDGRIIWLEERAEAQVSPDGTVERVIGVTLDIAERKRAELEGR